MPVGCPTPPNQRKRFFLNPKVLRSSFAAQRSSRRTASSPEPTVNENPSALSGTIISFFLNKIEIYLHVTLTRRKNSAIKVA